MIKTLRFLFQIGVLIAFVAQAFFSLDTGKPDLRQVAVGPAAPEAGADAETGFRFVDLGQSSARRPAGSDQLFQRRPRGAFSGTAWRLHPDLPVWITARHVTEGCTDLAFLGPGNPGRSPERHPVDRLIEHDRYDAAALVGRIGSEALPLDARQPPRGARAVSIGYPQSHPASVILSYQGRANVVPFQQARGLPARPYDYWRVLRYPTVDGGRLTELGGLSGGPVILADGRVVGIIVGSNPRRGTTVSTPAAVIQFDRPPAPVPTPDWAPIADERAVDAVAVRLLNSAIIEQVICRIR